MRAATYQRRTPPRDLRIQVDMSAGDARELIGALKTLTSCSFTEARVADKLEKAIETALRKAFAL